MEQNKGSQPGRAVYSKLPQPSSHGDLVMPVHSIVPVFFVPDVTRTAIWYHEELGFEVDPVPAEPPYVFAILRHGSGELMLRSLGPNAAPAPAPGWEGYIRLHGNVIRRLHDQLAGRGLVVRALERMPYGMVEFEIEDCDRRRLCFGEYLP